MENELSGILAGAAGKSKVKDAMRQVEERTGARAQEHRAAVRRTLAGARVRQRRGDGSSSGNRDDAAAAATNTAAQQWQRELRHERRAARQQQLRRAALEGVSGGSARCAATLRTWAGRAAQQDGAAAGAVRALGGSCYSLPVCTYCGFIPLDANKKTVYSCAMPRVRLVEGSAITCSFATTVDA